MDTSKNEMSTNYFQALLEITDTTDFSAVLPLQP